MIKESGKKIVLIAAPSSSGKTSFAHRLSIHLKVNGINTVEVSISGSGSLTATCGVSNFTITQALADAVTVDVTLKPMAGETAPSFS